MQSSNKWAQDIKTTYKYFVSQDDIQVSSPTTPFT